VAKLTEWERVDLNDITVGETCPVCLCELRSEDLQSKDNANATERQENTSEEETTKKNKKDKLQNVTEDDIVRLSQCNGHYFHVRCITHCFVNGFIQCPICNVVYGIRVGTMPLGTMQVTIIPKVQFNAAY
jgi:hypothetical protein